MVENSHILYSFRRCPYVIRARLALSYSDINVELREVTLKDKPKELIEASSKATVPVMVLNNGSIIDESLDIMLWALKQNDPNQWLSSDNKGEIKDSQLIKENDTDFKQWLDRYKYASHYPEFNQNWYRERCENFLAKIEQILGKTKYLHGDNFGFTDAAILPFIRQFSLIKTGWFAESPYKNVILWLNTFLQEPLFLSVMHKYNQWISGDRIIYAHRL